jgi:hypothetical protein
MHTQVQLAENDEKLGSEEQELGNWTAKAKNFSGMSVEPG